MRASSIQPRFVRRLCIGLLSVVGCTLASWHVAARAESVTPPPPGLSVEPDAPIISRRFLLQYQLFIYPAYRNWLIMSDGEIDSLPAFTRFLEELPLSEYERFCYTQCYLMGRRS